MIAKTITQRLRAVELVVRRQLGFDGQAHALKRIREELEQDQVIVARATLQEVADKVASLVPALDKLDRVQALVGSEDVQDLLITLDARHDSQACRAASKLIRSIITTVSEE